MKKKSKGFILAETIAVCAVVLGSLILIYTQFITISRNYNTSFKYNNVDKLYAVNNILSYLKRDGLDNLKNDLVNRSFIDITNCSVNYVVEYLYCESLFDNLAVSNILFTTQDMANIKTADLSLYSQTFNDFIDYIVPSEGDDRYRLIVEFNDGTYATLKV